MTITTHLLICILNYESICFVDFQKQTRVCAQIFDWERDHKKFSVENKVIYDCDNFVEYAPIKVTPKRSK